MKRALLGFLVYFTTMSMAVAHEHVRDTATVELGKGKVTIEYGTPKLKGRNLDDMVKPGLAWRMGMDDPTTLQTSVTLDFGGKKLVPGKYILFARSDEKKNWMLLISNGTTPRFDPATVAAEVPLHFMTDKASVEILKITLDKGGDGASLTIAWGNYRLHSVFKLAS